MKKLLVFFIFLLVPALIGGRTYSEKEFIKEKEIIFCLYPETYEEYITRILCNMKLFSPVYKDVFYISVQENIDFLEVLPILMIENTTAYPFAIGKNYRKVFCPEKNKIINKVVSKDVGLFQLNSQYYDLFEKSYWDKEEVFDVFNYKHNSIVAIRLFKDLKKTFNNQTMYAVLAYNAGAGSVLNKSVPEKTYKEYLSKYYKYRNMINRSK